MTGLHIDAKYSIAGLKSQGTNEKLNEKHNGIVSLLEQYKREGCKIAYSVDCHLGDGAHPTGYVNALITVRKGSEGDVELLKKDISKLGFSATSS
jgi:hypothetical protein